MERLQNAVFTRGFGSVSTIKTIVKYRIFSKKWCSKWCSKRTGKKNGVVTVKDASKWINSTTQP